MQTQTEAVQPPTIIENTVLRHTPLTTASEDGQTTAVQLESWSIFDIVYRLRDAPAPLNGLAYLQPEQAIKVWERQHVGAPWSICAEFGVRIVSALVVNGRFMVEGGGAKLNTHPKISAWDISEPLFGRASQLRTPGRLRDFRVIGAQDHPVVPGLVVHYADQLDTRYIGAATFMNRVHRSPFGTPATTSGDPLQATVAKQDLALLPGCPLSVAAPATEHTPCKAGENVLAYEVGRDVLNLCQLPLPQVLSALEDDFKGRDGNLVKGVLTEYDSTWKTLQLEYLDAIKATELYVYRVCPPPPHSRNKPAWQGSEPVLVNPPAGYSLPVSAFVPEVYRNPMAPVVNGVTQDLGDPTMDYRLYERMLPFAGTHLDASLLSW